MAQRERSARKQQVLRWLLDPNQLGPPKPAAVVEHRDVLRLHAHEHRFRQILLTEVFHVLELARQQRQRVLGVGRALEDFGGGAHGKPGDLLPVGRVLVDRKRHLGRAPQVADLLAAAVAGEIERQAVIGVGHRRRLRVTVRPHGGEAHDTVGFELIEDEALG